MANCILCSACQRAALQLEAYRRFNEEAALRDHRRLGSELDLFRCVRAGRNQQILYHRVPV